MLVNMVGRFSDTARASDQYYFTLTFYFFFIPESTFSDVAQTTSLKFFNVYSYLQ